MATSQLQRPSIVNDQTDSPTFVLTLLGEPELRFPGGQLAGERWAILFGFLAYLAVEARTRPVRRETLAALMWPKLETVKQLSSLRQRLYSLNKRLGMHAEMFWKHTNERLSLSDQVQCDVHAFLLDSVASASVVLLESYRGDFCAGITVEGSELAQWMQSLRERCLHRAAQLASDASLTALHRNDFPAAKACLQRWLEIDPDDEVTGRALMQALSRSGHGADVQTFYRQWEEVLGREVTRQPEVPTRRLMTQILHSTAESNKPGNELEWRQLTLLRIEIALTRRRRQDDAGHQSIEEVDEETIALQLGNLLEQALIIVQQYGGHPVCMPGGILLAYFGYPAASERSAATAWETMRELRSRITELEQAKMVLHLARVLSSDLLPDHSGRLTDAVRGIAQRVPPGSCVITEAVRQLLALPVEQKLFVGTDLPEVYLINRFDSEPGAPDASGVFVGRDRDLATLLGQWQQIRSGGHGGMLIVGEAGIGKTRLLQAFRDIANSRWMTVCCNPNMSHTPLHPVLHAFGQPSGDSLVAFIRKRMATLGLDAAGRTGPAIETPAARTEVLNELVRLVEDAAALASDGLRVLMFEDLHWADRSTLEFIGCLLKSTRLTRCLVLATSRYIPEVPALANWAKLLELGPLDEAASGILFHALSRGRDAFGADEVINQCGGNPLFLCEMALAQGGNLPGSLEGLVMAQLERLGEGKHLAQWAAILGESLKLSLLKAVAAENTFDALNLLLRRGILVQHASGDLSFRHALIRRAVFQSLPSRRSQESHHHVAQIVERLFPVEAQQIPERMALWLTEANDWHGALIWRIKAGRQAMRLMAMWEAHGHWKACIALVAKLPESPERDVLEREARSSMGPAVLLTNTFGEDAHSNYVRMRELAHRAGDHQGQIDALWGMTFSEEQRGGQRAVQRLLREAIRLCGATGIATLPAVVKESLVHHLGLAGRLRRAYRIAEEIGQLKGGTVRDGRGMFHNASIAVRTLLMTVCLADFFLIRARLYVQVRATFDEVVPLTGAVGMDLYRVSINGLQGWCDIEQGQWDLGIESIESTLCEMEALKFRLSQGVLMIPLSRAYAAIGNLDKAEHWIGQAKLELCRRGNFAYRPFLLMTEAAIMLARNPTCLDGPLKKIDKAWQLGAREGAHTTMLQARTERFRLSPDKVSRKLLCEEVKFFDGQPELPDLADARQLLGE
jgi:DNA-binding SARP family transcriptional activator